MNTFSPAPRSRHSFYRMATAGVIGMTVAAVTFIGAATSAFAGAESNNLQQNQQLGPGQRLITSSGIALVMQGDGNLVEYAPGNRPVWSSNTNRANSVLRMQADGNLVIIAPGNVPVWSTKTGGNPGADLELQGDGNAVVYAQGHIAKWANGVQVSAPSGSSSRDAASAILNNANITLQTVHASGVRDSATARQNIVDTAAGRPAVRSSYGTAPGGTVTLSSRMLLALQQIGSEGRIRVSEIAGGSHSSTVSKHYSGVAFDIDQYGTRGSSAIVTRCQQLGATYAAFENGNHVHCQWA